MQTLEKELTKKDKFLQPLSEPLEGISAHVPEKIKSEAKAALEELHFPTRKTEAYKYTRVNKIVNAEWKTGDGAADVDLTDQSIPAIDAWKAVFVNGFYRADLSDLDTVQNGISCHAISDLDSSDLEGIYGAQSDHTTEIFSALNTAYSTGGMFIKSEKGAVSEKPIHIVHITTGKNTIAQPHHILVAETNSRLEVVQSFISQGESECFTNSLTEVLVEKNAELKLDKIQSISSEDHNLSSECVKQEKDSRFSINSMQIRGGWIRNNLNISSGEHCSTDLFGAYMPDGNEHVDNHTRVDHTLPHSESNELYKGIAKGKGTGVFNGKVHVHPHAQLTNAFQSNGNILMSDDATIHSKPELEIYADDVQCSHGSTTGQFDEEAVYYLRARGLSEESARKMLTSAFLSEAFENISNDALRVFVEEAFEAKNS